jgi:hypothetical protein
LGFRDSCRRSAATANWRGPTSSWRAALDSPDELRAALDAGADDVIRVTFEPEVVVARVAARPARRAPTLRNSDRQTRATRSSGHRDVEASGTNEAPRQHCPRTEAVKRTRSEKSTSHPAGATSAAPLPSSRLSPLRLSARACPNSPHGRARPRPPRARRGEAARANPPSPRSPKRAALPQLTDTQPTDASRTPLADLPSRSTGPAPFST